MRRLPVRGYEGIYEVSDCGRVFSLARTVIGRDGVTYPFPAKERTLHQNKQVQYYQVTLYKNNQGTAFYVHRLVAEAFLPAEADKPEVNHKDGDRLNNHISNLEWVDSSGNSQHAVDTGLRVYTNRLTHGEFIECLQSVIAGESYASLAERVPYQVPFLSVKLRKLAKELGVEHLLDESLMAQRVRRARINGAAAHRQSA